MSQLICIMHALACTTSGSRHTITYGTSVCEHQEQYQVDVSGGPKKLRIGNEYIVLISSNLNI